jgi:alpha-1,2-mannosyltransferase
MLVPVALIADRNWTALGSSVVAAGVLVGLSASVFGIDAWRQWADLAVATYSVPNAKWIEYGRMWGDSVYTCLVSGGASEGLANAAQVAAVVIAATAVYRAFRLPLPVDHQIAVLLACTILAAPHSSLHDAVMLAVAATLWIGDTAESGRFAVEMVARPVAVAGAALQPTVDRPDRPINAGSDCRIYRRDHHRRCDPACLARLCRPR